MWNTLAQQVQAGFSLTLPGLLALGAGGLLLVLRRQVRLILAGYLLALGVVEVFSVTL